MSEEDLLKAANEGNEQDLEEILINNSADINCKNHFNETPLQIAVGRGHTECIDLFLNHGAHLSVCDKKGYGVLHTAAMNGQSKCIETLLKKDSELINKENTRKETALHLAVSFGYVNCVEILLDNGAKTEVKDSRGNLPIHVAVLSGKEECLKMLLKKGALPSEMNSDGDPPTHIAILDNNTNCLKVLLSNGASSFNVDADGMSAIQYAEYINRKECLNILEKTGTRGLIDELKDLGLETMHEFRDMLRKGLYKCYWNRVYLVGPFGVGKTTLAKVLVGDKIPETREATDGIWVYLGRAGMNIEENKWVFLKEGSILNAAVQSMLKSKGLHKSDDQTEETKSTTANKKETNTGNRSSERAIAKTEVQNEGEATVKVPEDTVKYNKVTDVVANNETASAQAQETVTVNPPDKTENQQKSDKSETNEESIINLVLEECKKGSFKMIIVPIDLWDFGGQKIYYMTHQLFISSRGTFVILFNGTVGINEEISDFECLPGHQTEKTTAVYLSHWVNSILTYCKKTKRGNDWYPKIFFVATFKDIMPKKKIDEQRHLLMDSIEKLFEGHGGKEHLHFRPLIFVNAEDNDDPEIDQLREILMEAAVSHPQWGEMMPTSFVPLEIELTHQVEKGQRVISLEKLNNLNEQKGQMSLNPKELSIFLKIQHAMGKFIYFDEDKLRDNVVIDPTFLVEVLRSIVTEKQFWPKEEDLQKIFTKLGETGVLLRDDLHNIWNQDCFLHLLPYEDYIIDVLVRLDILIEPKEDSATTEKYFVVPCMVSKTREQKTYPNDKCIHMAYTFDEKVVPPAVLYRFLGSFISLWCLKKDDQPLLFVDSADVQIDEDHELNFYIEKNRLVLTLIHKKKNSHIASTIASTVQECLTRTIVKTTNFYQSITSDGDDAMEAQRGSRFPFSIEFGVQCSNYNGLCFFDYNLTSSENEWTCSIHKQTHQLEHLNLWFADKTPMAGDRCSTDCKGLEVSWLHRDLSDQHILRLAVFLNSDEAYELFMAFQGTEKRWNHPVRQWNDIRDRYRLYGPDDIRFFALHKWKECSNQPKFERLQVTLKAASIDEHCLCQVVTDISCETALCNSIPSERSTCSESIDRIARSMEIPDNEGVPSDEDIELLTKHIGDKTLQLGIELGLSVVEWQNIERNYYQLPDQTREVLNIWRMKDDRNVSYQVLAKALVRIGKVSVIRRLCHNQTQRGKTQ